jgi:hypothetical protein
VATNGRAAYGFEFLKRRPCTASLSAHETASPRPAPALHVGTGVVFLGAQGESHFEPVDLGARLTMKEAQPSAVWTKADER